MKRILYGLAFIFFMVYWVITLFFVSPNNPLNLSTQKFKNSFQANFFQRWAFFAPPPTFNQRVYIVLKNKSTQQKEGFEALSPILKSKSQKAPFNSTQQIFDYIFASSLINIEGHIRILQDVFNNQNSKADFKVSDSLKTESLVNEIEKTSDFKTLLNYSKIITQNNGINPREVVCQIQIFNIYTPQFIDRNLKNKKEEIMFSSHFLNFE